MSPALTPRGRISLERIENAAGAIDPVFLDTPQFECEPLSDACGARVVVKVETRPGPVSGTAGPRRRGE